MIAWNGTKSTERGEDMNGIGTKKVALLAAVVVAALVWHPGPSMGGGNITVTGDAEVRVVPDEILFTLGIENWNKDLKEAKAENDTRVKKVLAAAAQQGIAPRYLQTEFIHIAPRYEHEREKRNFIGYFCQKTVVITLKDIPKFEDVLSAVLESGVTHVHGIRFRTTELRKHRDQARDMALRAACEKANDMAQALGRKVGKPRSIQETPTFVFSYYDAWWGSSRGFQGAQNVVQNIGADSLASETTLAPGNISVTAKVTVNFELD